MLTSSRAKFEVEVQRLNIKPYLYDFTQVKGVYFSPAPVSTHLSQRNQMQLNYSKKEQINENLLQVTVDDRAMIFDLDRYDIDK